MSNVNCRGWRFALTALLVLCGTARADAQTAAERIQATYQKSQSAKTIADYDDLLARCDEIRAMEIKPIQLDYLKKLMAWSHDRRGELHAERAAQLTRAGKSDEAAERDAAALADFEAAVENDPTRWKAIHNRGVSYAVAGRYEDAVRDFSRVIELQPSHANAWFNRAEIRYESSDLENAIRDYDRAIQLKSNDAGAYTSRAHAKFQAKRFNEALRDYDQALRLDRSAETLVNRADAYRSLARWQQAAADYREAIRVASNDARAYQAAAWFMATCPDDRYRDTDSAVRAAERAIELNGSDDFRYLDTLAATYANAGRWDQAVETVQEAIEAAPEPERKWLEARLRLYEAEQPYRQGMDLSDAS